MGKGSSLAFALKMEIAPFLPFIGEGQLACFGTNKAPHLPFQRMGAARLLPKEVSMSPALQMGNMELACCYLKEPHLLAFN